MLLTPSYLLFLFLFFKTHNISISGIPSKMSIKNSKCMLWLPPAAASRESFKIQSQPMPVMKESRRLILLRHAKTSWKDRSIKDYDRPLSKAGETDVIQVTYKLQHLGWIPQLILSSDATRTRQTLKIMQEHVHALLEAETHFISSFYSVAAMDGQTAHHLQQAICKYARDDIHTLMCMGHNRGWEEAASAFSGASIELKTCNAALLEAAGRSWEEAFLLAGDGGWQLKQLVKPN
ncbi:hypothetical protein QVD17_21303 [Tagetes erecta]|uniref:Uncharacterized protein n=1 Tax=Tagetes erecta TaxID=13708 RepID=A0AAD8KN98_TARER|nr:hypothetical protein QVD17_21303 [Tagetes erecta]